MRPARPAPGVAVALTIYQSRTGTRRNLDAMRKAGFRLLVSAAADHRTEGLPYALDNGAWTARGTGGFDFKAFRALVETLGGDADWTVAPDIVEGGRHSLELSRRALPWVLGRTRLALIAVQDGISREDVAGMVGPRVGIAIGGSDSWKERAMATREFSGLGCHLHALRVNTRRRMVLAKLAGCQSIDGTSGSRFAKNIPKLVRWNQEETLWK